MYQCEQWYVTNNGCCFPSSWFWSQKLGVPYGPLGIGKMG